MEKKLFPVHPPQSPLRVRGGGDKREYMIQQVIQEARELRDYVTKGGGDRRRGGGRSLEKASQMFFYN